MITATFKGRTVKVDGLVNRGGWFGETWLVEIGMGFNSCFVVVEADTDADAIDELADSPRWSHLIKTDDKCTACENGYYDGCECSFAGNYRERVDLDNVYVHRCQVNYFAKRDN